MSPNNREGIINPESNNMNLRIAQTAMLAAVDRLPEVTWKQALLLRPASLTIDRYLGRVYSETIRKIDHPSKAQPFYALIHIGNHSIVGNPPPYHPKMLIPFIRPDISTIKDRNESVVEKLGLLNMYLLSFMSIQNANQTGVSYFQEMFGLDYKPNNNDINSFNREGIIHFDAIGDEYLKLHNRPIQDEEGGLWKFADILEHQFGLMLIPYGNSNYEADYKSAVAWNLSHSKRLV